MTLLYQLKMTKEENSVKVSELIELERIRLGESAHCALRSFVILRLIAVTCSEMSRLRSQSLMYCWFLQTTLESQVFDEKDKAQRLQTELDVSEQVQRDFVKLSQTLQVNIISSFGSESNLCKR